FRSLLLLTQLNAVIGQAPATLAMLSRGALGAALGLQGADAALQEQIGSFTTRQFTGRTQISGHCFCSSLNATFLGRTATVVRNRRHVGNVGDLESGVVQGAHGGLTTGARALDLNVQVLEAVFLRGEPSFLSGDLRGE